MSLNVSDRRRLWLTFQRTELLSLTVTHRRRWLESHRAQLTLDQQALLQEDILLIDTEVARADTDAVAMSCLKEHFDRMRAQLPRESIDQLALFSRL